MPHFDWDWVPNGLQIRDVNAGDAFGNVEFGMAFVGGTLPIVHAAMTDRDPPHVVSTSWNDPVSGIYTGEAYNTYAPTNRASFALTINPTSDPHIHVDATARVDESGTLTITGVGAPWKEDGVGATVLGGVSLALAVASAGASAGFLASAPNLAASIGNAVLGPELAAAYPQLVTVVGQTAVNTVFNGGDVAKAVKSAASSFIGANVGGAVAATSGLDAVGRAAGAATSAALQGGDIKAAAAMTLLQSGFKSGAQAMDDFFSDGSSGLDPIEYDFTTDAAGSTLFDGSVSYGDAGSTPAGGFPDSEVIDPSVADVGIFDSVGDIHFDTNSGTVASGGGVVDTGNGLGSLGNLTNLALSALKVYQTWNAAGKPALATPGVKHNPNGSTTTPTKGGLLVNTSAGGRTSTSTMPVGKPYVFADGTIVTNNGDGSFTTIHSDGSSSTSAYPSNVRSSASINPAWLAAGAVGVVVLVAMGARRH
jgi:hypothetical protein